MDVPVFSISQTVQLWTSCYRLDLFFINNLISEWRDLFIHYDTGQ